MSYENTTAYPEVERYAAKDTEHAHQVALFMWVARCNADLDREGDPAYHRGVLSFRSSCDKDIAHRGFQPEQLRNMRHMFAIPNGGERAAPVAARMKAEGAKTGVSDIFLPVPVFTTDERGQYALKGCGLFLEMKRPEIRERVDGCVKFGKITQTKGVVKPEQQGWFAAMTVQGYKTATAWTFIEALDRIWEYMNT